MNRTRDGLNKNLTKYRDLAVLAQALSSPIRLEIIESLAQREQSVEALAEVCALGVKTMSHHLQKLRAVGLVERTAHGRKAIYSLRDGEVVKLWTHLWAFAEGRRGDKNTGIIHQG